MPLSHSHQFLCVPLNPPTAGLPPPTVRTPTGCAGSVTSQISWAELLSPRSMYTLLSCTGRELPSHTRTIWAPPLPDVPTGMCARYFGCAGSVTSTTDVPFGSLWPVSGLYE